MLERALIGMWNNQTNRPLTTYKSKLWINSPEPQPSVV